MENSCNHPCSLFLVHPCIWARSCSKPKRTFASIALDTKTKEELISDLNEYPQLGNYRQISLDTTLTSLGTSKSLVVIDKLPYTTTVTLFIHSPVGYLLFRSSAVGDSHDSWEPHRGKILPQDASLGGAISREIRSLIGLDCTKIHHYHVVADSPDSEQLYTLNFYVLAHVSQTADPKGESFRFRWMVPDESQADIDSQTLDALRVLHSKSGHKHGS